MSLVLRSRRHLTSIFGFSSPALSQTYVSMGTKMIKIPYSEASHMIPCRPKMTSLPTSGLSFLDLPAELRIQIYQHLFEAAQIIVNCSRASMPPLVVPSLKGATCGGGFQRHLLSTCRTIRNEATAYLLAATTLQISHPLDEAVPIPPYYLANIPRLIVADPKAFSREPFRADRLQGLQVMELHNIIIWCKFHSESFFLESEVGSPTMFGLALYNLNRISPALTSLIGRKGRSFKIRLVCQFVVSSATHDTIVCFSIPPPIFRAARRSLRGC
jgi:hypothetical protein